MIADFIILGILLAVFVFLAVCLAIASGRRKDQAAEDEAQMQALSRYQKKTGKKE